ncbi:hypothetical protein PHLGIDRAFT_184950 [Phlebiopsis gigantea 11061_1 CR5-6]|uniref:Secreted protein n=1 Tax=Phlebiopsis gigantea (strain 11061_1 CR5-6) TaxID=745531 RepID=A0A0C3S4V9_PHLG1|nr:hypothetical protein PHLGIDRAFT_184950 [Phlebiopsis gigantea 11061_1 CR5-6]
MFSFVWPCSLFPVQVALSYPSYRLWGGGRGDQTCLRVLRDKCSQVEREGPKREPILSVDVVGHPAEGERERDPMGDSFCLRK